MATERERLHTLIPYRAQSAKAKEWGVPASYLSDVLRGRRPVTLEFLAKVALAENISLRWLKTGKGRKEMVAPGAVAEGPGADFAPPSENERLKELVREMADLVGLEMPGPPGAAIVHFVTAAEAERLEISEEYAAIPLLADPAAAGAPTEIKDSDIEGQCIIYRSRLRNPAETTCIWVRGDSMEPVLPDRSIVAVNHARADAAALNNRIVAVFHDGGVTVKRLQVSADHILLVPENRLHSPLVFSPDSDRIIGAVEWAWVQFG
ncbi:MAG: S24 family peptidase [Planctomycetota bacterium]